MNISEVKLTTNEQSRTASPNVELNKTLQQDGLRQAKALNDSFIERSVQTLSDKNTVALKIVNNAMSHSLKLGNDSLKLDDATSGNATLADDRQHNEPFFDVEKVAKNVLSFVEGVITKAANNGADSEKLTSLFSQARAGVSQGIELAQRDLDGLSTDEIDSGIENSRAIIHDGIDNLETSLLNYEENEAKHPSTSIISEQSAQYSNSELSKLSITTNDGDTVHIRFGQSDKLTLSNSIKNVETESDNSRQLESRAVKEGNTTLSSTQSFSFSVEGELDDSELNAINELVISMDDLANTFFKGNVEEAFEQAMRLEYNNNELASFAMQLNKSESLHAVKKYGEVKHYKEDSDADISSPKTVAEYMNKMFKTIEKSSEIVPNSDDYNKLINGLINEMVDVHTPDLLSAIHRFHTFNTQLIEGIDTAFLKRNEKSSNI